MQPAPFPQSNMVLVAPDGHNESKPEDEKVGDAPAFTCPRAGVIVTCWEPSAAEYAEFMATGKVWLTVMGGAHPPVTLSTASPFAVPDDELTPDDELPASEGKGADDAAS